MSGYSTDNSNLQNEMDYAVGNPVVAERGSSLLEVDQFYDCVEQLSNTEPQVQDYRNLRFRDRGSATEMLPSATSAALGERSTTFDALFGSSIRTNNPQQPTSGTSSEMYEEQKISKKLKNLGISSDKRRDKQALSVVLKNLKEFGEDVKEGGLTPDHRNSEPCLGPLSKNYNPDVNEKFAKRQKDKDKTPVPFICGPPGASVWCTLDLKKTASDSDAPSKEISTLRNLRLDSLEDYFKFDLK